jgi:cytochrome c biogenesis protein CcdA
MFRLAVAVISIGLADSLNPSTVGSALYLTTVPKRVLRVAEFTFSFFVVNFAAGAILTIGPERSLVGFVPNPKGMVRHVIELVAGVVLLACALALWSGRRSLARRELPMRGGRGGSAFIAGASLATVELPTAVPYFAVIAAVVASSATVPEEIALLALYNLAYVLPLLAILVVLLFAGDRTDRTLQRGSAWLQRTWPVVLAGLLLTIGSILIVLGGIGLFS